MNRIVLLCALLCGFVGLSSEAHAQNLVYKIDFSGGKGINFHTFEGGYVVVPLLGGEASFLLTKTEDGRTYIRADGAGKFFIAVSGGGDQKAVLSSTTGSGTAEGFMVGLGDVNHLIKVNSRTVSLTMRVAKSLNGTIVSADDESASASPATDGSLGNAGVAEFKMVLDEDHTNDANKNSRTLEQIMTDQLILELERQGFSAVVPDDDGSTDPDPDDDPQ